MSIYFVPQIKTITKKDEENSGLAYVVKGLSALRNEPSITAISSAFAHFAKACHLGLSDEERTLSAELRPDIVDLMEQRARDFMPEIYNPAETKLRIVSAEGRTLIQQAEVMKAKSEFLYKYQMLLSILYNLQPNEDLKQQIITFAKAAIRLQERELAPKLIQHFAKTDIKLPA